MDVLARMDEMGKLAWIGAMVLGFVLWWPVGLTVLMFLVFTGRFRAMRCAGAGQWFNMEAHQPGGGWSRWGGCGGRNGGFRDERLTLKRSSHGDSDAVIDVRIGALGEHGALLLADDLTRAVRVDRASSAISSAAATSRRNRAVPVCSSTSMTPRNSLAVPSFPDSTASCMARCSFAVAVGTSPCLRAASPSCTTCASSA